MGCSPRLGAQAVRSCVKGSVDSLGIAAATLQLPPSARSPIGMMPHSALLDDGVDDALGDVDDGLADPRGAAVPLAAGDPIRAVLDAE